MVKLYAERNAQAQGEHYTKHVLAMTAEKLHSKSDIASELAHRDIEIERLTAQLTVLGEALRAVIWDCENCDWSCFVCSHDYGMNETDLYLAAKRAVDNLPSRALKAQAVLEAAKEANRKGAIGDRYLRESIRALDEIESQKRG